MNDSFKLIIAVGELLETDVTSAETALKAIPESAFLKLYEAQHSVFAPLASMAFPTVLAFIRGLAFAERLKACPFPGSVSLLIPAFACCKNRSEEDVATLTDWIVVNHENPYTPFNFRKTRDAWVIARARSSSPLETLFRFRQIESEKNLHQKFRQSQHLTKQAITQLRHGESPASSEIRERIIRQMEREITEG